MKLRKLLPRFVRIHVKHFLNNITAYYQRLIPINNTSVEDIFVVGFPKSGNTWLQNIVVELVYGLDTQTLPDGILQDLVPDVHYRRHYKRYKKRVCFKSHHFPQPEYRNVLYVMRDGRDAMVSYYHYLKANGTGFASMDDLISQRSSVFPGNWEDHIEEWISNPFGANIKFIKYEDLLDSPEKIILEIAQFLECDITMEKACAIAENTSFKNMKSKEQALGWEADRHWPSEYKFVRKGRKGAYLEEMSQNAQSNFLKDSRQTFERLGYIDCRSSRVTDSAPSSLEDN